MTNDIVVVVLSDGPEGVKVKNRKCFVLFFLLFTLFGMAELNSGIVDRWIVSTTSTASDFPSFEVPQRRRNSNSIRNGDSVGFLTF